MKKAERERVILEDENIKRLCREFGGVEVTTCLCQKKKRT